MIRSLNEIIIKSSDLLFESVTQVNIEKYEHIFYCNKEYYLITEGRQATKKDCIDTINYCPNNFSRNKVLNVGGTYKGEPVAFLSILESYPEDDVLWIGLFLMDEKYKRKAIGTKIINALITATEQSSISKLRLSVQDNNIAGVKFWGKVGFKTISQCDCGHYNNLTMEYNVPTKCR